MAVKDEKVKRALEQKLITTDDGKEKALEREKRKRTKRLAELDKLFANLFESKVMEQITERNYQQMSARYEEEQAENESRLKEIEAQLQHKSDSKQSVSDFISLVGKYQGLTELSASVVNDLIERIDVFEREKQVDGSVTQVIKIYFKFVGLLDELHIVPTKRYSVLSEKKCACCGAMFIPGSPVAKYCPACSERIHKKQSNESKRRSRARQKEVA